jgi:STE24 endopeptidase
LGHHVHNHILKSIGIEALVTFVGFWAATQLVHLAVRQHMFINDADFADLPLLLLVSTLVGFLLIPALNAWSRHNERQADLYALQSIPDVTPFIDAMNKLAKQNLAERTPSRWVEWFFHSHPPVSKRIAAAEAWSRQRASAKPVSQP